MLRKLFKYIEPIWLGSDDKVSIRRVLTLIFSFNLTLNISRAISQIKPGQTYADYAILLGVEAGLITALMSLTTYSTTVAKRNDKSETD